MALVIQANLPTPAGRSVCFYSVREAERIGSVSVPEHRLMQLGDGEGVAVSSKIGCLILYGHAEPIGVQVIARNSFAMNTREEFRLALNN